MIADRHDWIVQAVERGLNSREIGAELGVTRQRVDAYLVAAGLDVARKRVRAEQEAARESAAARDALFAKLERAQDDHIRWKTGVEAQRDEWLPYLEAGTKPAGKSEQVWGWVRAGWRAANNIGPTGRRLDHAHVAEAVRVYLARSKRRHVFSPAEWENADTGVTRQIAQWRIMFVPELLAMFTAPDGITETGDLMYDDG